MPVTTCVFDAYGTLYDVNAAARQAAEEPGFEHLKGQWAELSATWRAKQLQYTWIRALTESHADFWQVTQEALDFAMDATGLGSDRDMRARLLSLYWELAAFEEVPEVLAQLSEAGLKIAILSNGSPDMLAGAARSAGIDPFLDASLSVEQVGVFKPHKTVYDLVGQEFGCANDQVLFVSSNGWDAAAAAGYGFHTAWVNRGHEPMDCLPWKPAHRLSSLHNVPKLAMSL